jgi:hypothetical protein
MTAEIIRLGTVSATQRYEGLEMRRLLRHPPPAARRLGTILLPIFNKGKFGRPRTTTSGTSNSPCYAYIMTSISIYLAAVDDN